MQTTAVAALFGELRSELVPVIAKLATMEIDDSYLHLSCPVAQQRQLVGETIALMGFDPDGWRLDDTVHPFATSFDTGDVRITTRWEESYFPGALYGAMHECGHGLYEAGIARELQRTPLGSGEALGVHESQSGMWETMAGPGAPVS